MNIKNDNVAENVAFILSDILVEEMTEAEYKICELLNKSGYGEFDSEDVFKSLSHPSYSDCTL